MRRKLQCFGLALILTSAVPSASAFSLLGPLDVWQTPDLGYNPTGIDIGGPMNLSEEYRWNLRTITYAFDPTFVSYFGQRGVEEVEKAIAILNALPTATKLKSRLDTYPTDTRRVNQRASALQLLDLKSYALGLLVEEIGLASPERYVWTIRNTWTIDDTQFYAVIQRNFDPVTLRPSAYVNDTLYTYAVVDPIELSDGTTFADAVEFPVDPTASTYTAVASTIDGFWGGFLNYGQFITGLTRDDVSGIVYIYNRNNYNVENLVPGSIAGNGGAIWSPVDQVGTNVVDGGLRPGVDKLQFRRGHFDSLFGRYLETTNRYTDTYVTNSVARQQGVIRVLNDPDILFRAADLGPSGDGTPFAIFRTTAADPIWINNSELNSAGGFGTIAGPGQIQPRVEITFNRVGPYIVNDDSAPVFLQEAGGLRGYVWGSFDGTTNAPVVYPFGASVEELENQVLQGGGITPIGF